ncbi:MAG: flotillin family protein [Chlamydiia bacterium]|jgi:flotillin|nr:flotillin family protein [Chlamydiota bacterium]
METILLTLFSALGLFLILSIRLYQRCPSNKILVIYGRVGFGKTIQCHHGGGRIVWPLIQGYAFLDLTPKTIHISLKGALSQQNIRVNIPSTFTVALGVNPEIMQNAAIRLLDLDARSIEMMATEIITGQLRLTIASLRIEEINQDRERFLEAIKDNIEEELHKIGLTLLNVNITDITDESEYIDSIGKKASSTAVNQAKVDVAEQEKQGEVGKASQERDCRILVASYNADAVRGENESAAEIAATNAMLAEKEAEAKRRSQTALEQAEAEIQKAKSLANTHRLEAEQIVPQEIQKRKIEIEAQAEAQSKILVAKGEAEAILLIKEAEALGIQKILDAKARGYKQLIDACNQDAQSASTMLLMEKLETMVSLQTEAIKNIKIDKITVWDSGNQGDNQKSTTSNFLSQFVKSLPPLHDVAGMAGLKMPDYLGTVKTSQESSEKEFQLQ